MDDAASQGPSLADGASRQGPSLADGAAPSAPAFLPARAGRENQRYDEQGRRLVAGCIVVREQAEGGERECLMINSSKEPTKWIFPKGGWETDETVEAAAVRETLEESGADSEIVRKLGWFGDATPACIFEAKLVTLHDSWAEVGERKRLWMPLSKAIESCKHPFMAEAIRALKDSPRA
ncbi:NUDIX hydrolase domain-like protein [Baffinella frigidus]|nr:NUDIX hydrolase domain-like protein [Cryptophyta sp. CCMP2293]